MAAESRSELSDSQAQVPENEKTKKNGVSVRGVDWGRVDINMCHIAVKSQERAEGGRPQVILSFGKLWAMLETSYLNVILLKCYLLSNYLQFINTTDFEQLGQHPYELKLQKRFCVLNTDGKNKYLW